MNPRIDIDLGDGHTLQFTSFAPDRELNPQYDGIPDTDRFGAIIDHVQPDGTPCSGCINFDGDVQRKVLKDERHMWKVERWEPLTISPSVLCLTCGDHGFIREGKWVRA